MIAILSLIGVSGAVALFKEAPNVLGTSSVTQSVGLDVDTDNTPANTATSLGTNQSCRSVSNGATFTVDFWVKDIDSPGIESFQGDILYDNTRLKVTGNNVSMMLAAASGSSVNNFTNSTTDALPDTDGKFTPAAYDFGTAPGHSETGSGVLARLTFQAVADGISPLTLTNVLLGDPSLPTPNPIGDVNGDGYFDGAISSAEIRIGQACPTPTPSPTPTPTDSDVDGIPDGSDNCPLWHNPSQAYPLVGIHPTAGDADCDGFPDPTVVAGRATETYIGTDPLVMCAATGAINDEFGLDANPMDFNDNQIFNGQDSGQFGGAGGGFNKLVSGGPYNGRPGERYNFNGDTVISGADTGKYGGASGYYNKVCVPSGP